MVYRVGRRLLSRFAFPNEKHVTASFGGECNLLA
jgi:hypothetical protein